MANKQSIKAQHQLALVVILSELDQQNFKANDDELYTHLGAAADGALTVDKTRNALGIETDKTNLTILVKDSLRQSVEIASGGEQTVLYTAKGQPTYMNIIKKFDMSTIDPSLSGTHPAFIVDGVEKPEIFIGTYQGRIVGGAA